MIVPRSTIYKWKKKFFLLLFLYYHVFPYPLRYFTKQHQDSWKAVARDIAETQRGAAAPCPNRRSGEVISGWAYSSESKKRSGGKGQGEAERQRVAEEDGGVSPMALRRGARGRSHSIGGGWRILGHRIQAQEDHCQRWERAIALQEG